ncbi:nuclear transport factor 2 family protein [Fulvivirga kasyanovii]|uniref:Nuclear transport factor 2 family protein n=1 Tax=Fulvivirga kasyanovii TaxID=396812 RepID=A0ABW9RPC1_9BACT|nr:nuclear transport factor 2 family protein [Fulvivirga kasyanovii]MTI25587.1 nuclear transport factor 2 family protein [Fulvivirga kasyanovii]
MITLYRTGIITCITLFMLSCSGNVKEKTRSDARSSETDGDTTQADVFSVSEEDLFSLLTQWKEAQNSGDFEAYSILYGDDFRGIKRSGENTFTFDREDWLKDRQRMFQKPMTVDISDVKIFMQDRPYRILFKQGWSNGTYYDLGPKHLSVKVSGDRLKIVKEEMLESRLASTTNDINNVMNYPLFYAREGNYVHIPVDFSNAQLLRKDKVCDERWHETHCIDVSYFSIDSTQTPLDSVINKNIFIGSINSDSVSTHTIAGWRAISKSLRDSLPGITHPSSIFERRYFWVGGYERTTPLSSALFFGGEELPIEQGQWALISSRKPFVYRKKEIAEELRQSLLNQTGEEDTHSYSLEYFEGKTQNFATTAEVSSECGENVFDNIKLWEVKGEILLFVKDLPDLPVSILDLDGDDHLDMLYHDNFREDPNTNIWWESPNFAKRGDDTVFLSCGC